MASTDKTVHFSDRFAISCGTVTVDVERSKVLLVRWQKTGEFFLPKGRKDLGEHLEQTAVRVQLLPAVIEPIAVSQRVTKGILKMIFWYIAMADSTAPREEGTQQENEEFDTVWADFDSFGTLLSFEDDRSIATAAFDAVCRGLTSASEG
ncbi:hypothetical protein ACRALDRAFT_2044667 [Sodiomyces alcalophilus JCM 7366]|uniref:uncharacterized protein n=1 Tax=Sodiomyces alcalophilus JCM 7366 TaxID=591952 RepID=UPI0039B46F79